MIVSQETKICAYIVFERNKNYVISAIYGLNMGGNEKYI